MTELEQVRSNPQTRASSPSDPAEWTITEDGYRFGKNDRVYNYYDGEWVVVMEDPAGTFDGWFLVRREHFTSVGGYYLNSVRVSAHPPSNRSAPPA
jgi:hypothetical protein